jgi:hypothetical protein
VASRDLPGVLEDAGIGPEREEIDLGLRETTGQLPNDGKEEDDVPDAVELDEQDLPGGMYLGPLAGKGCKKGKQSNLRRSEISVDLSLE